MFVRYKINGQFRRVNDTNEDIEVFEQRKNNRHIVKITAKKDVTLADATEVIPFHVNYKDLYFLNGYQSWTDTKEFKLVKRLRNVKKSPHVIVSLYGLNKYGDSTFYDYSIKKSHGYDVFYSRGNYESFIYNLNYKIAYLIIELIKDKRDLYLTSELRGRTLKAGEEITAFDYCFYDNFEKGLESFNRDFPKLDNIEKVFGYTSWYNYYQNITEDIILRDLDALDKRFNVFQIDDGYETFVGDWLDIDPNKFPNGLQAVVNKIHDKGYKAGIWLAPFVAETKSKLFSEHPDWIKKDNKGNMVMAGGNWSKFYSLDLEKEEVKDYITKCLKYYMDLGFDFFKLDFLYASSIVPFAGKTRCETQDISYQLLRDILSDKLILGCGANIMNSYQKFDYLRIGPDVSLKFDDTALMRLFHRERISTKITLQNTIFRSIFNEHLFFNDPDVFLLRDNNISLSPSQREALTKINALFGGVLMTSDNIKDYDDDKKKKLGEALELFESSKVLSYKMNKKIIEIIYELNNEKHTLKYSINKGVFI